MELSNEFTVAAPLEKTKVFPAMVVQMIAVGESTGAMDTMLNKIADFYDDEVDSAVTALTPRCPLHFLSSCLSQALNLPKSSVVTTSTSRFSGLMRFLPST